MHLYAKYSGPEAVQSLCTGQRTSVLCDGQFVCGEELVLCFFSATDAVPGARLVTPSTLAWRPAKVDLRPQDLSLWLPDQARKPRSPRQTSNLHMLFVRRPSAETYTFLGPAHLGSYGVHAGNPTAEFFLTNRVPRAIWLELGGYSGWQVEVDHAVTHVDTGDLAAFRDLLARVTRSEYGHVCLTRYEEDSLHLHTNRQRAWLMYLREPEDSGLYLAGNMGPAEHEREQFRCGCGISLDFPRGRTAPIADGVAIAEAFFVGGQLPERWIWTEEHE
jgi:hypothetical protein